MGELISELFSGFTTAIEGLGEGIKSAFMQLLYADPTAETLVLYDVAKFGFVMIGLSMAIGLVYFMFRLIRRRA